mmetsp:Transcript_5263/g.11296  ORF Transcript_5263/g.11296 Transcript_5263/m.11296 type:complete len:235 (+) Transcript_5263:51-755(+)
MSLSYFELERHPPHRAPPPILLLVAVRTALLRLVRRVAVPLPPKVDAVGPRRAGWLPNEYEALVRQVSILDDLRYLGRVALPLDPGAVAQRRAVARLVIVLPRDAGWWRAVLAPDAPVARPPRALGVVPVGQLAHVRLARHRLLLQGMGQLPDHHARAHHVARILNQPLDEVRHAAVVVLHKLRLGVRTFVRALLGPRLGSVALHAVAPRLHTHLEDELRVRALGRDHVGKRQP